jgi:hypothetical protein
VGVVNHHSILSQPRVARTDQAHAVPPHPWAARAFTRVARRSARSKLGQIRVSRPYTYTPAYGAVEAVFAPRWRGYTGVNLTADELSDLVECIVLHWLYIYNINYRDLGVQFWLPPANDLDHPQTYRIVLSMVSRRLKRGRQGHDQLCGALLDISVAEYRRWAIGNDRFMDR